MNNNVLNFFILVIIIYLFTKYIIWKNIEYKDNILLNNFLNENEINILEKSFNYEKNDKTIIMKIIKNKLKEKLKVNYININYGRYSDGIKKGKSNYDGQRYHRDIKSYANNKDVAKVYTVIYFLDDTLHQQGDKKYKVKANDCLIFSSFNLHRGLDMDYFSKKKRRVLQLFHVFFDEEEEKNFYKKHSFATHIDTDYFFYLDYYTDFRSYFEYYNLVPFVVPHNKIKKDKNIKYITFISDNNLIGTYDKVKFYSKF